MATSNGKNHIENLIDSVNKSLSELHNNSQNEAFNPSELLELINNINSAVIKKYKQELFNILEVLNEYYFKKNSPLINDSDFDRFEKALNPSTLFDALENDGSYNGQISKGKHSIPMLSLDKFLVPKDVDDFIKKVMRYLNDSKGEYSYCVEPKIDGNSIALIYEQGKLIKALSRGDGKEGELLTANMQGIDSIPKLLRGNYPNEIEVRGEIFMPFQAFIELNNNQQSKDEKPFANPRNATAGTLRNLDANIVKQRNLQFIPWGFGKVSDNWLQDSTFANMERLKDLGFNVNIHNKFCHNIQEAIKHYEYLESIREKLDYEIDGVVFKIDSLQLQLRLGNTEKAPRWAGAYKFASSSEKSQILDITLQIGRSGVITPVAELKPVNVAGVVISRATLHNFDYIVSKDIRIGDIVVIKRAGDVIPKVEEVDVSARDSNVKSYQMPTNCPACGSILIKENAFLKCSNNMYVCSAIFLRYLEHMVGKGAFDIAGLATRQLEFFIEKKLISMPHHIFELEEHANTIISFEGFQEKSVSNLINAINKAKNISFDRFIYALGINQIGEKMAKVLATNFKNIDVLIQEILHGNNLEIQGIGESILQDLKTYFNSSKNINMINNLLQYVNIEDYTQETIASKLTNKKILFTGTLKMARKEAQNLAQKNGAIILSAVSKNLDYLICGQDAGSKLIKAKELNIEILSEEDFLNLIS